jgi:transcriptional regulator with XRE-family HTH domain
MITNQRQYQISKKQIREFESAVEQARRVGPDPGVHERIQHAMVDGLRSQLQDLREQVERFEALRAGKVRTRSLRSWADLPLALIEGRIAAGLTQGAMARKLGIPEQQVQRYESTRYAGASLERLQAVAEAIGLTTNETVTYPVPKAPAAGRVKRARVEPVKRARPEAGATAKATRKRTTKTGTKPATSKATPEAAAQRKRAARAPRKKRQTSA